MGIGKYGWKLVFCEAGGHRLYKATAGEHAGRVAICDQSGPFPQFTDDGVIWIAGYRDSIDLRDGALTIRAYSDRTGDTSVIISELFAWWLTSALGWALRLAPRGQVETRDGVAFADKNK